MSFSTYNPYDRYKQRSAKRAGSVITVLFLFVGLFSLGYWVGGLSARQNIYILQGEKASLTEEYEISQDNVIKLRAEAQTANVRLEQLRARYEELLSEGPVRDLLVMVRKQIEQGVAVERLQSVILSARPPQNCSDAEVKRFVVRTPVYKGPNSRALIGGGKVSIEGRGVSAKNSQGQKEAWFDPGQPIDLVFKARGVKSTQKKGLLPIRHSMIVGDKEYRFTLSIGAKSFVKVTYDHCDYP